MARLKGSGKIQKTKAKRLAYEKEINKQHRETIFSGGYSNENEDSLYGYNEGEIL